MNLNLNRGEAADNPLNANPEVVAAAGGPLPKMAFGGPGTGAKAPISNLKSQISNANAGGPPQPPAQASRPLRAGLAIPTQAEAEAAATVLDCQRLLAQLVTQIDQGRAWLAAGHARLAATPEGPAAAQRAGYHPELVERFSAMLDADIQVLTGEAVDTHPEVTARVTARDAEITVRAFESDEAMEAAIAAHKAQAAQAAQTPPAIRRGMNLDEEALG